MTASVDKVFRDAGAIMHGHFVLTSGRHSPVYWEKFRVIEQPEATVKLCRMIVENFKHDGIEVVAGPTTGGVVLAYEVARQMGVRCAFAEKTEKGRGFRRGLAIEPGERILIVDDILTTGLSLRDVIGAVKQESAEIVGIGVLIDRSEPAVDFGFPLFSCLRNPAVSYPQESCPQCRNGEPFTRLGGI